MAHYNDINKANNKRPRSSHDNSTGRGSDNPYKNAERLSNPTYTGTLTGKVIDPYTLQSSLEFSDSTLEFSGSNEEMPFDLQALDDTVDIKETAASLPRNNQDITLDKSNKDNSILIDSSLISGNNNASGLGGVPVITAGLLDKVGALLDSGSEDLLEHTSPLDKSSNTSIALKDAFTLALKASELPLDAEDFFTNSSLGQFLGTDPELYKNLSLTPEAANRMRSHLAAVKHGTYASVPLICKGYESCPIRSSCWFVTRGDDGRLDLTASKFPLLQPCPVEASILQVKVKQYCIEHFNNLNHITPTIISLATKLAELDIYEMRVNMLLSQGDTLGEGRDLMQEMVMSADLHGNPVKTAMREHPAFSLKERFQKMRSTLMKELLASPEAKLNARAKIEASKAESVSATMTRMSAALNKINNLIRDNSNDDDLYGYDE